MTEKNVKTGMCCAGVVSPAEQGTLMHSGYLCKCPHAPVAMCSAPSFGCLGNLL